MYDGLVESPKVNVSVLKTWVFVEDKNPLTQHCPADGWRSILPSAAPPPHTRTAWFGTMPGPCGRIMHGTADGCLCMGRAGLKSSGPSLNTIRCLAHIPSTRGGRKSAGFNKFSGAVALSTALVGPSRSVEEGIAGAAISRLVKKVGDEFPRREGNNAFCSTFLL